MSIARSLNPVLGKILQKKVKIPGRKFIDDPVTCQAIIDKLDLKTKYPSSEKLDIIDVFAGYGLFSSMLNYELQPRNHVIIDKTPAAIDAWESRIDFLKQTTNNKENFQLYPKDGYSWDTYTSLFEDKIVNSSIKPRTHIHDELLFVANLTTALSGESLLAQWITCCAYRNWIHKYGRVRMICFIPDTTARKFLAGPCFVKRNKASLKIDLFTNTRLIAITDSKFTAESTGTGFDPNLLFRDQPIVISSSSTRQAKSGFAVIEIAPKDVSADNIDVHEELTQRIFMHKKRPLVQALSLVAPGADEDLAKTLPQELLRKNPIDLDTDEWNLVYKAYDEWPFKPDAFGTDFLEEDSRHF